MVESAALAAKLQAPLIAVSGGRFPLMRFLVGSAGEVGVSLVDVHGKDRELVHYIPVGDVGQKSIASQPDSVP